jgi:hypothetical protein
VSTQALRLDESAGAVGKRARAVRIGPALELAGVLTLLELDLWVLRDGVHPFWRVLTYGLVGGIIAAFHRGRRLRGTLAYEPRRHAKLRGICECVAATVACAAVLIGACRFFGDGTIRIAFPLEDKTTVRLLGWLVTKLSGVVAQQLALQLFLLPVFLALIGRRPQATLAAACVFALLHAPNAALVLLTLAAGVLWITLYQRSCPLAALVASHLSLAVLAHAALPERWSHDLRVGVRMLPELAREPLHRFDGSLRVVGLPERSRPGQPIRARAVIVNRSPYRWSGGSDMQVCVAVRLRHMRTGEASGFRTDLPAPGVAPDQSAEVELCFAAPVTPGTYEVSCRLFQRGWSPFPGSSVRDTRMIRVSEPAATEPGNATETGAAE